MSSDKFDAGLKVRKEVLGEEYVENALKNVDDFNRPMQELVTEYCWGTIWTRDGLPKKTRSLLNLAMLTALNRPHEVRTEVAREGLADLAVAGVRGLLEKGLHGHEDPGRAEAALQAVGLVKGLLQRVQAVAVGRQALDGEDLAALGLRGQHQAGPHGQAIDEHRAGAADDGFFH